MGSVYKKQVTKAIPKGAKVITRADGKMLAKWLGSKNEPRSAKVIINKAGQQRISIEVGTYIACYKDHAGITREVSTGETSKDAAQFKLAELMKRAQRVRSGVISAAEDAIADQQATLLEDHFGDFRSHLEAKQAGQTHCNNVISYLKRLAAKLNWKAMRDIERTAFDRWLAERTREAAAAETDEDRLKTMSARTRNAYRNAWVSFCNWAKENNRLASNPLATAPKANEKSDPRRQRRAMTEAELNQLLEVARRRPLEDARTVRAGKHKGKLVAKLSPETIERLEQLGRERSLIYKTLVLTGLRKSELASLTIGQLHLDAELPYAELAAADEKNREGSSIPLRRDLADDLQAWISEKQAATRGVLKIGAPESLEFSRMTVFDVPAGLVRILDRDLARAKIAKRDDRGRTLDVHALRTSFGTLLSKGGVSPSHGSKRDAPFVYRTHDGRLHRPAPA
jgi:integrase